ncbi:MAG: IPT/TIG domain-containing protein, partial [Isosphaeraceae bacterium]
SFDENQYQLQAELLRHGAVNWVTRGVYFGDQRNYYEADIDDNFLSDDSWSTTEHTTDYNPADAVRETPSDVEYAAKWSSTNKLRMDMLFNGGGSAQYEAEHGSDPLLTAFQKYKASFGWISHTWDHPNLDIGCASQSYIEAELNENNAFATSSLGLTASTSPTAALGNDNPSVIITGEHSGLANLLPGNPGVVDPPDLDSAEADTTNQEGKLAAGSYVYAVTDDFVAGGGQSIASESSPVTVTGANGTVTLTWGAVCHAAEFKVYREVAGSNQWRLIATIPAPTQAPPNSWFSSPLTNTAVTGGGPLELTYTDTGAAGSTSSAPPSVSEAVETAYPQNPNLIEAFKGVGIQYFGSDASKAYPNPAIPGSTTAAYPAGATFTDGTAEAIPRYPTNIYYNVSTEAEEVDEFNSLYTSTSEGGKCVPSANTTCETKPATFAEIVSDVDTNMFQHVMGNDPRPHYFHQPNIMGSPPPGPPTSGTPPATSKTVGDGLFYSVLNPLLEQYSKYFSAPIEQPTMAQIGQLLAEQQAWDEADTGQVSGYIEGSQVTVDNSGAGAVNAPLTGVTGVGSSYGGIQSGWTSVPAGTSTHPTPVNWPEVARVTTVSLPQASANAAYSQTLAASGGATPYSWSLSSGSLPAGLSLNPTTGTISGTPTATATSSFTIKVTDSSTPTPRTAIANLSITVLPNPPVVASTAAASATQTAATLNATVNPNGGEVSKCEFEYGTTNSYGQTAPCSPPPGSGSSPVAVSAAIAGLTANTTYDFRVSATNAGGTSKGNEESFTTLPIPPPTISSISSASGPAGGGATVTIKGSGFVAGATVTIGSEASAAEIISETEIRARTAATAAGSYEVIVKDENGTSTGGPGYTYIPAPTVESITPAQGPIGGSTLVKITGTGFTEGATVTIGGAASEVKVLSATEVTAITPAGTGAQEVVIKDEGGSSTLGPTYTYLPAPAVAPGTANSVKQTTATATATVNPNGGEVSECKFEYGTTISYGQSASCATLPGSGSSPVEVTASLSGLTANTTYHFRISATNAGGTSKGSDETFKTLP